MFNYKPNNFPNTVCNREEKNIYIPKLVCQYVPPDTPQIKPSLAPIF